VFCNLFTTLDVMWTALN